ncbi:LacI family DNA-binding transcriptional regulator [Natronospora cellulosivora (SeqCode)]
MSNIYDIAKIAGVSIATVSKVINDRHDVSDETKKRIRKIMQENNYIPNSVARSLTTNQSGSIGIIFNYYHEEGLNNMFFQEVLFGAEKVMGKAGYDYVYFSDQKWHDTYAYDYLGKCKNRMVDGAILLGIHKDENMSRLLESNLPVVLIDLEYSNETTSYVSSDNERGAYQALDYLYDLGHKKIGMIMGPRGIGPADIRLKGFTKALQNKNLKYNEEWIIEADFEEKYAYKAMQRILSQSDRPTAIFCQADVIAIAAIKAIRDAGLNVPDDFSIIGFDDIEVSKYITPSLTTVSQNTYQLGENAAEMLLKMIKSPKKRISPVILPSRLVKRNSCKKYN